MAFDHAAADVRNRLIELNDQAVAATSQSCAGRRRRP